MSEIKTILVIGATGHFGGRICRRLIGEPNTRLIVASRNLSKATSFANELKTLSASYEVIPYSIDQYSSTFEQDLYNLSPDIVVHTAGPYQGQSYSVAKACIAARCHYLDLADGREFVERFSELDEAAKNAGILAVSGASTLPGLSSAVINRFRDKFLSINAVNISIAPAHQTPRGIGTISAVLSYCGKSFDVLEDGTSVTRYGWQDLRWQQYPELGRRLSGACDVPDLSLLRDYLLGIKTVTFHAALEAWWEQLGLWCMGWLTRFGLIKNWLGLVPFFESLSEKLINFGSEKGGMHIRISGTGTDGKQKELTWYLTAKRNHGPEVPCTPALVLVRKLARNELSQRGAFPCLGLITLDDFDAEVKALEISWQIVSE